MNKKFFLLLPLLSLVWTPLASAQLTPQEAITQMARGINLGNTLEPPREGDWNNGPMQEYYFDDFKTAGFESVRIPVRWDKHTSGTAPFKVAESWMNRVEQAVDWGLERGFIIIINGHHDDWLKENYANALFRARYDSIWSQISLHFKDKSDRLFFEIMNEPFGMTRLEVDDLNARILSIIRKSNPTRIVVFGGKEWSGADQLLAAAIPDDDFLMGYFHSYDPWEFAGAARGTWGTPADRAKIAELFKKVANWSSSHNIPVMISEFGAIRGADFNSRMLHYSTYVEEALRNRIAFQVWDDGGDFAVYQRKERDWNEIKDILTKTAISGPTLLNTDVEGDSVMVLSWTNRNAPVTGISIERSTVGGDFKGIAELTGGSSSFADTAIAGGVTYLYRVVSHVVNSPSMYSYPLKVHVKPTERSPFRGVPFTVPGAFEAEDYDVGGEGLTYHDTEPENIPGVYRPNEGVDLEKRDDGGVHAAYLEASEWFEYTIDVKEAGKHTITSHVASPEGGGIFQFSFDGRLSRIVTAPSTGDWMTLTTVDRKVTLNAGKQIMRVTILSRPGFNIDCFGIERSAATANEGAELPPNQTFAVYPNPVVGSSLTLLLDTDRQTDFQVQVYNLLGQMVLTSPHTDPKSTIDVRELPPGMYAVRAWQGEDLIGHQLIVRQ